MQRYPKKPPSLTKGGASSPHNIKRSFWDAQVQVGGQDGLEQKRACLEVPPQGDQPHIPMSASRSRRRLWLPVFLMLGLYSSPLVEPKRLAPGVETDIAQGRDKLTARRVSPKTLSTSRVD